MPRRIPSSSSDSLELLLDTMCNTFGGIILIALLIALLAREVKVGGGAAQTTVTTNDVVRASNEWARAQSHYEWWEKRATNLQERMVWWRALEGWREKVRQLPGPPNSEPTANTNLIWTIGVLSNRFDSLTNQIADATGQIARIDEEIAALQGQLRTLNVPSSAVRPPMGHSSAREGVQVILRANLIYPLFYMVNGKTEMNERSLTWNRQYVDTSGGERRFVMAEIEPMAGAGFTTNHAVQIQQWLRPFDTNKWDILCYVYDDSFPAFLMFRLLASQAGFDYGWKPLLPTDKLRFGPGGADLERIGGPR